MSRHNIYNHLFKVDEKYIEILKSIGFFKTVDNETEKVLRNAEEINYSQTWTTTIPTLDNNKLIEIFKGIVVAEKHFQWRDGSAATGVWLYQEIRKRKIDLDLELGNWAFLYTDNFYVPFGSAGNIRAQSKDAYDYVRNSQMQYSLDLTSETIEKINSYSSYLDQRTIEELKVDNATLRRKLRDLEEDIIKINTEKENLKLRLTLSKKSNIEKAKHIIENDTRIIYFYSDEIEQIIADKNVPSELLERIKNKFNDSKNKNNIVLKNRLINEINNR
jgi:hypothetical protein